MAIVGVDSIAWLHGMHPPLLHLDIKLSNLLVLMTLRPSCHALRERDSQVLRCPYVLAVPRVAHS